MKKKWIVIALAACAIAFAGCKVVSNPEPVVELEPIAVESVALNATTLTLAPGDTRKLTAAVKPDDADDKSVKWSSSDTSVAMVGSDGTVVAIKVGTAAITAQAGGKTAICAVIVKEAAAENPDSPVVNPDSPVAVEGVTLNAETLTIEPGKTRTLTATVTPINADDKTVTWSSSNVDVATVDSDGTVTAHAEGTTTITAQASGRTATCAVTVRPILNPVENITLSETMLTLTLTFTHSETKILKATVTPDNADDKTVLWWSSNEYVATVDSDGKVTAVDVGTATIFAQAGDMMATCMVNVEAIPVESITLDKDTLVLTCGEKWKLNVTITPEDAYYRGVSWWSRDRDWSSYHDDTFVTVDSDGTVTALKEGTAIVYAQAGGKTAECTVTVKPAPIPVESVTLDPELTLHPGETYTIFATVTPYNADDKTVTWSSSNPSVATVTDSLGLVDGYGKVTAVAEGTATITAQAGGKKTTCAVTVSSPFVIEGSVLTKYTGSSSTVTIPAGVTQIGSEAFKGCSNLTTVNIPASVTSIASGAFGGCDNVKTMNYGGTLAQWCSVQNYSYLTGRASSVMLGDGTNLKTLTKLEIPAGVQYIGEYAFSYCTALESVVIPDSVTDIREGAFGYCTALGSVDIPDSVTDIRKEAFLRCEGLKTVTISKNVSSIETLVFGGCKSLTSVTIPAGVKSIEYGAFIDCSNLTEVTIPDGVETIGECAFARCYKLTEITIPNGVKSIEDSAFQDCLRLAKVSIPASVKSIGQYAFSNCSIGLVVYYDGKQSQWNVIEGIDIIKLVKGTTIRCNDTTWSVK